MKNFLLDDWDSLEYTRRNKLGNQERSLPILILILPVFSILVYLYESYLCLDRDQVEFYFSAITNPYQSPIYCYYGIRVGFGGQDSQIDNIEVLPYYYGDHLEKSPSSAEARRKE
jgi:hypothetical protein